MELGTENKPLKQKHGWGVKKSGLVMLIATGLSFVLALCFQFFPPKWNGFGLNNTDAHSQDMTRVFDLDSGSVMAITLPNKDCSIRRGICLYSQILYRENSISHCDLPDDARIVYSVMNEEGDTVDAREVPLRELVADSSYAVSNLFYFSSDGVPEEARIRIDFALQNVPDDYVIAFYGYHYDTDDERDVLTLEHNDISARSVLLYAEVVDINDDSIAMLLWIVTAVLAAGAILLCGEKHEKTGP